MSTETIAPPRQLVVITPEGDRHVVGAVGENYTVETTGNGDLHVSIGTSENVGPSAAIFARGHWARIVFEEVGSDGLATKTVGARLKDCDGDTWELFPNGQWGWVEKANGAPKRRPSSGAWGLDSLRIHYGPLVAVR